MPITQEGERTLTASQKRRLKQIRGFRCDNCHRKFKPEYLQIHHKKGISKYSSKNLIYVPVITLDKKYIPPYDRHRSNLQVLCISCHNKTKGKKPKKRRTKTKHHAIRRERDIRSQIFDKRYFG